MKNWLGLIAISIVLSGCGLDPELEHNFPKGEEPIVKNAAALSFSPSPIEATLDPQSIFNETVTVTNVSNTPVNSLNLSWFSQMNYSSFTTTCDSLQPGETCLIYLTIANPSVGIDNGTMMLDNSQVEGKVNVKYTSVGTIQDPNDKQFSTPEDTPLTIGLENYQVNITQQPTSGTLSVNFNQVVYTPNQNYNGNDSFKYTLQENTEVSAEAEVSIVVTPVNDSPTAANQTIAGFRNETKSVSLFGSDLDGDSILFSLVNPPVGVTLVGNLLTYSSVSSITQQVTYKVSDGQLEAQGIVTFNISNRVPTSQNQSVSAIVGQTKQINLLGTDQDNDSLSVVLVQGPTKGSLNISGLTLSYTPNQNGSDIIKYKLTDGEAQSAIYTVSINNTSINTAPVAQSASYNLTTLGSFSFQLQGSDSENNPLQYIVVQQPNGAVTGTAPNLSFVPNGSGQTTLTFKVNDGQLDSNVASITFNVNPENQPPNAQDLQLSTLEDTPLNFSLNVSDPENDSLTILISSSTLGTFSNNNLFVPNLNANGQEVVTYSVSDGNSTVVKNINITVTLVNDAPVVVDVSGTAEKNTNFVTTLQGSDVDGDPLTYSLLNAPINATISGNILTISNVQQNETFQYIANDGSLNSNQGIITFVATEPQNQAPVLNNLSLTTPEDTPVNFTLNATDPNNDPLVFTLGSPGSGSISQNGNVVTYTPNLNFNGNDTITYSVSDGQLSDSKVVSISVTPVNDAPNANDLNLSIQLQSSINFTLSGSDIENDPLSFSLGNVPSGSIVNNGNNSYTFTPANSGVVTIPFTVSDGQLQDQGSVVINVQGNLPPIANNQSASVQEDQSVIIILQGSDPENQTLSYTITNPGNGTAVAIGNSVTYTPNLNYNGTDIFTYTVSDGQAQSQGIVNITVHPVNDAPIAIDQNLSIDINQSIAFSLTGSDVDNQNLIYTIGAASSGNVVNNGNNSYTYSPAGLGSASIPFTVSDGVLQDSGVITIVTTGNSTPLAQNQSASTAEDQSVSITLQGSDPDNQPLTYSTTNPSNGSVSINGNVVVYTPNQNYNGTDSFIYTVSDGTGQAQGVVSIVVTPVNDSPVPNNLTLSVDISQTVSFTLSATDVDNDPLLFILGSVQNGSLVNNGNNSYTYSPNSTGSVSIPFSVNDGTSTVNGLVSINVTGNLPPTAQNLSIVTQEDQSVAINLIANDPENQALTYTIVGPSHGSVSGTAPNLTYTPALNYHGNDTLTYVVSDGQLQAQGVVSIQVISVNDAPVAIDQSLTTDVSQSITFSLLATDADNDPLNYTINSVSSGSIVDNGNNSYTFTPANPGAVAIYFTVSDGSLSAQGTVGIHVTGSLNNPPVAVDQNFNLQEDQPLSLVLNANDPDGQLLVYSVSSPSNGSLSGVAPNLIYTPNINYYGVDSFTYIVSDGLATASATVSLNISSVNDAPTGENLNLNAIVGTPIHIIINGSDVENDPLSLSITIAPNKGTETHNGLNIAYNPTSVGTDILKYKLSDSSLESIEYTITINNTQNTPVNQAPIANDLVKKYKKNKRKWINLEGSDPDSNPITYSIVSQPSNGTLTPHNSNPKRFKYMPNLDFTGTDSFTYKVNDGTVDSNIATVTLNYHSGPIFNNNRKVGMTTILLALSSLEDLDVVDDHDGSSCQNKKHHHYNSHKYCTHDDHKHGKHHKHHSKCNHGLFHHSAHKYCSHDDHKHNKHHKHHSKCNHNSSHHGNYYKKYHSSHKYNGHGYGHSKHHDKNKHHHGKDHKHNGHCKHTQSQGTISIAQKIVNKAIDYSMQKQIHTYWSHREHSVRKALLILGKDHRNEHPGEMELLERLVNNKISGSVDTLIEPAGGIQKSDLDGYDLIWYTVPGYPVRSADSMKILEEAFYDDYKAIVLSGDDLANNMSGEMESLTMLKYENNGTSACGKPINNNSHPNVYLGNLDGNIYRYGNDIDHTIGLPGVDILSRATTDVPNCSVDIPVIVGHRIAVPNSHICK
jgi:hypothetical protein